MLNTLRHLINGLVVTVFRCAIVRNWNVILLSGWAIFSWLRWLINVFMQFHSQSKYLIVIGNVLFRFFQVGVITLTGEICDFYRTQRERALCSWLGWDNRTRNKPLKNRSVVYGFKKKTLRRTIEQLSAVVGMPKKPTEHCRHVVKWNYGTEASFSSLTVQLVWVHSSAVVCSVWENKF